MSPTATELSIKFVARRGARMTDDQAERYTGELRRLYDADTALTAENVVSAATRRRSPLRDWFEWDNDAAAHQYRLHQARKLMQGIEFTVSDEAGLPSKPVRFFWAIAFEEEDEKAETAYVPITVIHGNPDMQQQAMARALRLLIGVRARFGHLKKLDELVDWEAVERLLSEYDLAA